MYTLAFRSRARGSLRRLDATIRTRILDKLDRLRESGPMGRHKVLKGKDRGKFSVPVGSYRIVYSFDTQEQVLIVHRVGHRSSVY
ncbi:type II toxin-antitoxin system RelE/ParE family toxin [Candidatus Poribacteria bacterium]|nr:MAG: type II toxin-antitoxin system RelE/ParE family toxin [Candidatus Poribacteria bacterium]